MYKSKNWLIMSLLMCSVSIQAQLQFYQDAPEPSLNPENQAETLREDQLFKEYQRMEDTNTKACTGSQDCSLAETTNDNQLNRKPVDLSNPNTAPNLDNLMPQFDRAAEQAEKNNDMPKLCKRSRLFQMRYG